MNRHPLPAAVLSAVAAGVLGLTTVAAQELAVSREPAAAPSEIVEPIRTLLQSDATVVMRGSNKLEFWWLKGLPLDSTPSGQPSWSNVAEGALVGVVRLSETMDDIRGRPIKAGVYTLRYAQQPQDGDHLGASPFREFLLVGPAADDQAAEPVGYKGAVALGKKTLGRSHPAALSLDPPTAEGPAGRLVANEAGHKGVTFTLPVVIQGKPAGALSFGLILVGRYDH